MVFRVVSRAPWSESRDETRPGTGSPAVIFCDTGCRYKKNIAQGCPPFVLICSPGKEFRGDGTGRICFDLPTLLSEVFLNWDRG